MKFLEATEILTTNSPWCEYRGTRDEIFVLKTASGDLLHLESRVLWLLEPGGFEPGIERKKKKPWGNWRC